jgi:hypothetical protein
VERERQDYWGLRKGFSAESHCPLTKSDGRRPFTPEEEAAILRVVRQRKVWPAFEGVDFTIGLKGFRAFGFHELAEAPSQPPKSDATPRPTSRAVSAEPNLEFEVKRAHFDERRTSLGLSRVFVQDDEELASKWDGPPLAVQQEYSAHELLPAFPTPPEPLLSPARNEGSNAGFLFEVLDLLIP